MPIFDYFDKVADGIEFLIALGSVIGFLGLILGIILFMVSGPRMRVYMIELIVISIMLIAVCGLHTGTKYFRIY